MFEDVTLYNLALRHSSLSRRRSNVDNNERLEFLGDAVLNACVSKLLYDRYPRVREGTLSKAKSFLVSTRTLAQIARSINLGDYILLSKSAEQSGARENENILASTFEAITGAFFLQKGFDATYQLLKPFFEDCLNTIENIDELTDYKSRLQELAQQIMKTKPVYILVGEEGPDHSKRFTMKVQINGIEYGTGTGKSKKEAQQEAAKNALQRFPLNHQ